MGGLFTKVIFQVIFYDLQKLQLPDDGHVNAFCWNVADLPFYCSNKIVWIKFLECLNCKFLIKKYFKCSILKLKVYTKIKEKVINSFMAWMFQKRSFTGSHKFLLKIFFLFCTKSFKIFKIYCSQRVSKDLQIILMAFSTARSNVCKILLSHWEQPLSLSMHLNNHKNLLQMSYGSIIAMNFLLMNIWCEFFY